MDSVTLFKILDVSFIKRDKTSITTNNKNYSVLSYRLKGESEFKYKNKFFIVTPDDILFIPSGCSYSQTTNGEELMCIHFEAYGELSKDLQILRLDEKEKIPSLFKKILKSWSKREENYFYHCTACLYEIIAVTSAAVKQDRKSGILSLLEYIEKNCTDFDFKISDVYEACNLSHSSVNSLFKKETGMTPSEYVNRLKIQKAKILLSGNCFTTAEIAELCGFRDIKYFYTVFHKVSGYTVRDYKENCCKMAE